MKKLVILLGMFFMFGCDSSGYYEDDTDWGTDFSQSSEPLSTPDLSEPGQAAGSKLIKYISDVDSDDRRVDNDLEKIVNPISNPIDELSI